MYRTASCGNTGRVALLAEGVDRNIQTTLDECVDVRVALLAEGVDRNGFGLFFLVNAQSRPPRGGRG